jgi:hypothetical protein
MTFELLAGSYVMPGEPRAAVYWLGICKGERSARVEEDMRVPTRGAQRPLIFSVVLVLLAPATSLAAGQVGLRPAAGAAGSPVVLSASGFPASKRVVIGVTGSRSRTVMTSRRGTFQKRMIIRRRRGWLTVVSRTGRTRVVNRFLVRNRSGAKEVIDIASTRGQRLRISPTTLFPGSTLRVHGTGFGRSTKVKLSGPGVSRTVKTRRNGAFDATLVLPESARVGRSRLVVSRGAVHFSVAVSVSAPAVSQVGITPVVAPASTRPPAISGTPNVGQQLSVNRGEWSGTSPSFAYRWQRCSASMPNCVAISGATGALHTVAAADDAQTLRVVVSASNSAGTARAASPVTGVVKTPPTVTRNPVVPTSATVGQSISLKTAARFTGTAPIATSVQWQRCGETCVNVGTGNSYGVAQADLGYVLQVVVVATNDAAAVSVASKRSDPVKPQVVATGVVALWHMDDTGTTMVDSVGGHNGTLHNVATGLSGSLGTAFGFNGTNSYAFVPQSDALSAVDNDVTVSIRLRVSPGNAPDAAAEDDWDVIRSAGQYADGDEYKVEYDPDRTVRCAFKGNAGYREVFSDPAKPLDDGAWHTIKCVKTQTQVKTIVDGVTTSGAANIGTIVITKGIIIAAHPSTSATSGASEWFNGELDEASIAFG